MRQSAWLVAALAAVGCRTTGFTEYPRTDVQLGHQTPVKLGKLGREAKAGGLVKFTAKGPGRLSVDAENINEIKLFRDDGEELIASGVPPMSVAKLLPGTYFVGVIADEGAKAVVKTAFFPDDPEGDSGRDQKPEGAIALTPGVTHWGTVSGPELDRTDWLRCEVDEEEELTLTAFAQPKDAAELVLMLPGGEERAFDAKDRVFLEEPDPGSYLVQVRAKDARDAKYAVRCFGSRTDPDRASGADATIDGARELVWANESPQDAVATARESVDWTAGDASDWYVLRAPSEGTCDVKLTTGKALLSATTTSDTELELPKSTLGKRRCGPQPMWIRVSAEDATQGGEYVLSVRFHADAAADDTE